VLEDVERVRAGFHAQFGGLWYALSSSGNEVTTSAGSGSGSGY
jgi:hypothetical protein